MHPNPLPSQSTSGIVITINIMKFVSKSGIKVSAQAQAIIHDLLNSIVVDAHPRWRERSPKPQKVFDEFVEKIPSLLQEIAESEKVDKIITTWDILHWLSSRLDVMWPYPKDDTSESSIDPNSWSTIVSEEKKKPTQKNFFTSDES